MASGAFKKNFFNCFSTLCFFGIPYTIFYYPIDIFSWTPILFAALIFIPTSAIISAAMSNLSSSKPDPTIRKLRRRIFAAAICAALFALIASKGVEYFFSNILFQFIKFFMQPFFYLAITWSLSKTLFFAVCVSGLFFVAMYIVSSFKRGFTLKGFLVVALNSFWIAVCFSLYIFSVFKGGPPIEKCSQFKDIKNARLVLSRNAIEAIPGMSGALPYDSSVDAEEKFLFVSLKPVSSKPGAIVQVDLRNKRIISILPVALKQKGRFKANQFAERMAIIPERKELYALVLSPGNYRMFAISYASGKMKLRGSPPLPGEPNSIHYDPASGNVFVLYAGSDRNGFDIYSPATLKRTASFSPEELRGSMQQAGYSDDAPGRIFITAFGPAKITEYDTINNKILSSLKKTDMLEGIACSKGCRELFASAPLSRKLYVFSSNGYKKLAARDAQCALADVAYEERSGTVALAGYEGSLEFFRGESPWDKTGSMKLGSLLRNITAARNGKLYANSGCGVFEITPPDKTIN